MVSLHLFPDDPLTTVQSSFFILVTFLSQKFGVGGGSMNLIPTEPQASRTNVFLYPS